jgi:hypothetical protein
VGNDLRARILGKANGSFLWTPLVARELERVYSEEPEIGAIYLRLDLVSNATVYLRRLETRHQDRHELGRPQPSPSH